MANEEIKQVSDQLQELKKLVMAGSKNVLSVNDLHLLSGLSKSHIYKLVCKRKIPHYKSEGGKITYFRKDEVENWLCAFKVPTASEVERAAVAHCVNNPIEKGGIYAG